jgi:hypothetical protein
MFRPKVKKEEDMGLANQASYNTGNTVSGPDVGGPRPATSSPLTVFLVS